jgi:hypothetical protein
MQQEKEMVRDKKIRALSSMTINVWGSPKRGFACPQAEAMVEYEDRNRS